MQRLIQDIIDEMRIRESVSENKLATIIRASNKGKGQGQRHNAKKYLMPYYLEQKTKKSDVWNSWALSEAEDKKLSEILKVKPKRSASGVATITLITKPWPCGGNCIFCPNDIRMPKSYLNQEPACQRAERNFFDPYLQLSARLRALTEMGHSTDKVEIIILGGTWNDYSQNYQKWFVHEVFKALNNGVIEGEDTRIAERENSYRRLGFTNCLDTIEANVSQLQNDLDQQKTSYNEAFNLYYRNNPKYMELDQLQNCSWEDIYAQHEENETAKHRCVGLVVETRPAVINDENLEIMRRLGCTKVQIGVQSLCTDSMELCDRKTETDVVANAFSLLRKYGYKIHAHFMANLPGATPESDKQDFANLVSDGHFMPDEIKLYPCMLVKSARLNKMANNGKWQAYDEDTLVDVLADDVLRTPLFIRISRMMRDISSNDITQGVRKTNLRQMVENEAEKIANKKNTQIQEIRHREIALGSTEISDYKLDTFKYDTQNTTEYFLQIITAKNKILGFLRLSLPNDSAQAMIREVHVYGVVANVGESSSNAQHRGFGTMLIEEAYKISKDAGYKQIKVISAIGTRQYYRGREFDKMSDDGLYQVREL